jgi:serine/threonine-protein kinase RsbW
MAPDLVVIDNRSDPKGEFVSRVKIHKERSLTSIIKLYARDTDVEGGVDFKIWENDYLIEPFEVLELFSLTEAELTRLPKDKKVLHQQVHFEFRTTQENVEKAYKLADVILRQAGVTADEATALYAAVKEGIDNAAIHGNRFDGEKSINVNFLVDLKKVTVLIEDEGTGFDYEYYLTRLDDQETFERAKRRILDEGVRGGLGILLMSKCTNRLEYSGAGNILRLEKNL